MHHVNQSMNFLIEMKRRLFIVEQPIDDVHFQLYSSKRDRSVNKKRSRLFPISLDHPVAVVRPKYVINHISN
jgi:hypothetical protein